MNRLGLAGVLFGITCSFASVADFTIYGLTFLKNKPAVIAKQNVSNKK